MRKTKNTTIEIDLDGPDGNAFVLLQYASHLALSLGLDLKTIRSEMMEGDYENLVKVFSEYFSDHVILLNNNYKV